eukprot:6970148-Alexandrium_andersonii.AAC.1
MEAQWSTSNVRRPGGGDVFLFSNLRRRESAPEVALPERSRLQYWRPFGGGSEGAPLILR